MRNNDDASAMQQTSTLVETDTNKTNTTTCIIYIPITLYVHARLYCLCSRACVCVFNTACVHYIHSILYHIYTIYWYDTTNQIVARSEISRGRNVISTPQYRGGIKQCYTEIHHPTPVLSLARSPQFLNHVLV